MTIPTRQQLNRPISNTGFPVRNPSRIGPAFPNPGVKGSGVGSHRPIRFRNFSVMAGRGPTWIRRSDRGTTSPRIRLVPAWISRGQALPENTPKWAVIGDTEYGNHSLAWGRALRGGPASDIAVPGYAAFGQNSEFKIQILRITRFAHRALESPGCPVGGWNGAWGQERAFNRR